MFTGMIAVSICAGSVGDAHAERVARTAKRPAKTKVVPAASDKVVPAASQRTAAPAAAKHRASPSAARAAPRPASPGRSRRRATSEPRFRTPPLQLHPGRAIRCPSDMVAIGGSYCIDRYEGSLAEAVSGSFVPPFYPPEPELADQIFATFRTSRDRAAPNSLRATLAVPLPAGVASDVRAVSSPSRLPSGYLSGDSAAAACERAGKRLCSEAEWVTACRGEDQTAFPYGPDYVHGACNVYREHHPAALLHGVASRYHRDPRLNLVAYRGEPLLRKTGETTTCASRWGNDAVYDMVGNLDEWVDAPHGVFVGGFYSRGTRAGCAARISSHARGYFDYSTGVRCCKNPG